jgi:uncharacterized protein (TIGR00290 family)
MTIVKDKILLFWSGGKDSALALHSLMKDPKFEVVGLVTTFDRDSNTVKYHGIPDSLIIDQAKMLKLPLQRIFLPGNYSEGEYIDHVGKILSIFARRGIHHVAFGDVQSEAMKKFREDMLLPLEMKGHFPLWGKTSAEINKEFIETEHKALVTSIMRSKLDPSYLNREFNQEFISRLPEDVDPAGEKDEFHTFVTFSPHFRMRVPFSKAIAIEEGPYLVSLMKEP